MIELEDLLKGRRDCLAKADHYWSEYQGGGTKRDLANYHKWEDMASVYDLAIRNKTAVEEYQKRKHDEVLGILNRISSLDKQTYEKHEVMKLLHEILWM